MFWDGTRWIDERAPVSAVPSRRQRPRRWLTTGVLTIGIIALAMPPVAASSSSPFSVPPVAAWSGSPGALMFGDTGWVQVEDELTRSSGAHEPLFTALVSNVTRVLAAATAPVSSAPAGAMPGSTLQLTQTPAVAPTAVPTPSPASVPTPPTAQLFGVSSRPDLLSLPDNIADFDRLAAASMKLVRFDAKWSQLEPTAKGTFNPDFFERMDEIMALADARGITLILCFDKTPGWANGGAGMGAPPTNHQDYADALGVLAAHYKDRPGMLYEIWNEPNYIDFWDTPGGPDPAAYTDMLKRAYTAAKTADPDATIIAGSLSHNDQTYLAGMYAAGAHDSFDAFSIHPYTDGLAVEDTSFATFSFRPEIEGIRASLLAHGDDVPIWLTEFGYSTAPGYARVSEANRASYLAGAVRIVRSEPFVQGMAVFTLNTLNDARYGLTIHDGAASSSWTSYVDAVRGE